MKVNKKIENKEEKISKESQDLYINYLKEKFKTENNNPQNNELTKKNNTILEKYNFSKYSNSTINIF